MPELEFLHELNKPSRVEVVMDVKVVAEQVLGVVTVEAVEVEELAVTVVVVVELVVL